MFGGISHFLQSSGTVMSRALIGQWHIVLTLELTPSSPTDLLSSNLARTCIWFRFILKVFNSVVKSSFSKWGTTADS